MSDLIHARWKVVAPQVSGLSNWIVATADAEPQTSFLDGITIWPALGTFLDGKVAEHVVGLHNAWVDETTTRNSLWGPP